MGLKLANFPITEKIVLKKRYVTNYDTMAVQAAMFAGFAFDQITEPVPEGTDISVECTYN